MKSYSNKGGKGGGGGGGAYKGYSALSLIALQVFFPSMYLCRLQLIALLLNKWKDCLPAREHPPLLSLLQKMLRESESKR